ncbi:C-terminal helicase domain-containing protein [Streptomyces sp. NPDC094038]|uniref:C-terminal helicase domain-containing protein n=1 Tax=Streptomyces sp. NPDC094038 TaxID=3366055 RepID=UPI0037F57DEA
MTADQIASGSLSIGYAMTIAASQGLTCNTSRMYGHGANAFACYPGITRARRENHIWLPLDVVESEQTQARLGAARSDRERMERAIRAFAEFLGQSRPDSMVSDLLFEQPEAAAVPPQRDIAADEGLADDGREPEAVADDQEQKVATDQDLPRLTEEHLAKLEQMRGQRAVPAWSARPYGDVTDRALDREITSNEKLAEEFEDLARGNDAAARALAAKLERESAAGQTRGQQYAAEAGVVLDQAGELLATARRELETAAAMRRTVEERANWLSELAKGDQKGWLTPRLAGTSRKEQRELSDLYAGERVAARNEQLRAENAARHGSAG